jgi:hypothetical protein
MLALVLLVYRHHCMPWLIGILLLGGQKEMGGKRFLGLIREQRVLESKREKK